MTSDTMFKCQQFVLPIMFVWPSTSPDLPSDNISKLLRLLGLECGVDLVLGPPTVPDLGKNISSL